MGTSASRIAKGTSAEKSIDIALRDDQYDLVSYNGWENDPKAAIRAMASGVCPAAPCKPDAVWWENILKPRETCAAPG